MLKVNTKVTWNTIVFIINFTYYFTPCFRVSMLIFEHVISFWVVDIIKKPDKFN